MPQRQTHGVSSARRVLQILLQFSEKRPELTVDDLAEQHSISVASAYRYISLLRETGLIEERRRGVFVLSPQVLKLSRAAEAVLDYRRRAQPILDQLTAETGETALLLRRVKNTAMCVAIAESKQLLNISFTVGQAMPLHRGAGPKMLLATATQRERRTYLSGLQTSLSPTELKSLEEELGSIATAGYVQSEGEVDQGVWACAAPVFIGDHSVGALSLAAPASRVDEARREAMMLLLRSSAPTVAAALHPGGQYESS